MENGLSPEILDTHPKVCIGKASPSPRIKDAIRGGADTVLKVNAETGSGSGGCGGKRCAPKIYELIKAYKNGEWE